VLAQVNGLDRQIEQVTEAYDLAGVELARTRRQLRWNARGLRVARGNLARAQTALARILVARYVQGDADSTLTVVLGAASMNDLIDRLDAAQRIGDQDEQVMTQVRRYRARVLAEGRRLRQRQAAKRAFLQALGRRRAEIDGQLARRRRLLASIQSQVASLQARERAHQAQLRRQAETRLAADPPIPVAATSGNSLASDTPGSPPPTRHAHVVPILMRYLGIPYQWGGASPGTGFDCSGLVLYVYAQVGVALPHNAALQYGYGAPVDRADLQPGDIVFFSGLGHDGIYIGGGQFIDAPKTGDVVKIENLGDPWWTAAFVGARRLP
jgi:cell wall-associated NlpC family hydrolase